MMTMVVVAVAHVSAVMFVIVVTDLCIIALGRLNIKGRRKKEVSRTPALRSSLIIGILHLYTLFRQRRSSACRHPSVHNTIL